MPKLPAKLSANHPDDKADRLLRTATKLGVSKSDLLRYGAVLACAVADASPDMVKDNILNEKKRQRKIRL